MLKTFNISYFCLFICLVASLVTDSYAQTLENKSIPLPVKRPSLRHISQNFVTMEVRDGDTLSGILERAGVSRSDAIDAIIELRNIYSPSALKVGDKIRINFVFNKELRSREFMSMQIRIAPDVEVEVARIDGDLFLSQQIVKQLTTKLTEVNGTINATLFGAATAAGMPNSVLTDMIMLYSYDVDFQRDIRTGNSFKVIYEELVDDEEGKVVDTGNIISASLTMRKRELKIYRYQTADGTVDYYNEAGESIRKSLLRTPVDGVRITSGYGERKHPTLGYTKLHKGIDFGAPRGTPVYAAGDGVIERAGRFSSYGKYIRISHNNGYSTAYAHLSRYGKDIGSGKKVKQGQVIGYVGTTGRSTGPHLHYEVLVDNEQINPLSIKTVSGRKLRNAELSGFKNRMAQIDNLERNIKLAQTN